MAKNRPACKAELACGCRLLVDKDELGERQTSIYCRLHVAAPALLEALERIATCILPHRTEPNVVWIDTESLSTQFESARSAIRLATGGSVALAKGEQA